MSCFARAFVLMSATALALAGSPERACAQDPAPTQEPTPEPVIAERLNVISANPFGLLIDFFNAEYERALSRNSTAGFGGSFYPHVTEGESPYLNLDVFWRFYPSGTPFEGWSFGAKAGYTTELGLGAGFDVNRSWLMGADNNFYVGIGFGLKRILGTSGDDIEFVPTFRIVNVGFAF